FNCADHEEGRYVLQMISPEKTQPVYDFDDINNMNVPPYNLEEIEWPYTRNVKLGGKNLLLFQQTKDEYLGEYLYPHKCVDKISEEDCINICARNDNCVGVEWNPYYFRTAGSDTYQIYKNLCCPKRKITDVIP